MQVLNDPEVMKEAMNVALAVLARPEVNKVCRFIFIAFNKNLRFCIV
jgi:hypothetical protein